MAVSVLGFTVGPAVTVQNGGRLMAEPRRHRRGSDTLVRLVGPTDTSAGTVLDDASGAAAAIHLFDAAKSGRIISGQTRTRSAAVATDTSIQIPFFTPRWIESGDVIRITLDDGSKQSLTVSGYVATGTSYVTLTVTALAGAAAAGSKIELVSKSTTSSRIPIEMYGDDFEVGDTLDIETTTANLYINKTISQIRRIVATEADSDGTVQSAPNQPTFWVAEVDPLVTAVAPGGRIRRRIGSSINMSEYGTPVADSDEWGWEATIPDSQTGLEPGQIIEVECRFNGGAGLSDVRSLMLPIVG